MIINSFKNVMTSKRFFIRCFSQKVNLNINPLKCLHDEPVYITASNLGPSSNVTLVSAIKDDKGISFITNTHYRTDENGTLNLSEHPSLDGSYKGVFPMGPICALHPDPNSFKYQRFMKKDVTTPLVVNFKLLKGHVSEEQALNPDPDVVLDSVNHERIYMTEKTKRIPVREGRLRGSIFIPEGEGPFPGVIDLLGTAGGLVEYRSAQLAARGIASFSLAYYGFEDLQKDMREIDLSYFEEGVEYLLTNPKVKKNGVGAIGVSKGADIVCSMGTYIPKVKAVVSINGLGANTICPMKIKDRVIPYLGFIRDRVKVVGPDLISVYEVIQDSEDVPEARIPMHNSNAEFLFLCGKADDNWKTVLETERAAERMKANGKTNYEVIKYDGTGHLLEAPYAPFTPACFHKFANACITWGGNVKEHSAAQVQSWKTILEFFKKVL